MRDVILAPEIQAWQARDVVLAAGRPEPLEDLEGWRADLHRVSDLLAAEFTAPVPDAVRIDELEVADGLRAMRYRPADADEGKSLATHISLHGGAFVAGWVDEDVNHRLLANRVSRTGIQILAPAYRLAPEHPYPAAVEDAIATLRAVVTDPARFGADPARLGLGGISAGGAIAASAALRLAAEGDSPLRHLLLEVPVVSFQPHGESFEDYAHLLAGLDLGVLAFVYLTNPDSVDAYAEPMTAPNLAALPPTAVFTAEFDPLRDGGEAFAQLLRAAGVPVTAYRGTGHVHGSPGLTATYAAARAWEDEAVTVLRSAFG
jgi:acetyl esterase